MNARVRLVGAVLIVAVLLLFCGLLAKPYYRNWQLQRYVETTAYQPETAKAPEDILRVHIANQAALLGLPVGADQVRIQRSPKIGRAHV